MKMKQIKCIAAAAVAAVALAANAEMAIAYHGKLVAVGDAKISTKVPMAVEFRIFRNAEPGETSPLWGRRMPVRFGDDGTFYLELSDANGTATPNALYERLSDAIAASGGAGAWISVKPAECSELLPRKRLGCVHRAERAVTAAKAREVVASRLNAETINVGDCSISGSLTVGESLFSGGGIVNNTIDGKKDVSIGEADGTVLFSYTFNNWYNLNNTGLEVPRFAVDVLVGYKQDEDFGVFSLPVQGGSPGSGIKVKGKAFVIQQFIDSYYNPFF